MTADRTASGIRPDVPRTAADPAPPAGDFAAALDAATELAGMGPSSHNCQPWGLARLGGPAARRIAASLLGDAGDSEALTGEREYLALALDTDRSLGALAAHDVEMLVSCGAYWQVLLYALDAQGWSVHRLDLPPDGSGADLFGETWPASWTLLSLVELRRTGGPDGTLDALRKTVADRRTNRAPYAKRPVDPATFAALERPTPGALPSGGATVRHLTDGDLRRFVGLVRRYGGLDFSHGTAWRETHSFIRRDDAEAAALGTGFTMTQLFGPMSAPRSLFMRCALSPATMRLLRFTGYHRVLAWQLGAAVRQSAGISVLGWSTEHPDRAEMVRGGARLADYWLRVTRAGLALHPVSVVIQHDGPRHDVEATFGLPGRVFFVSRIGHPTAQFPPAPRRPAACFVRTL